MCPQAKQQLEDVLALPSETAIPCSAKEGIGIEDILEGDRGAHSATKTDRRADVAGARV